MYHWYPHGSKNLVDLRAWYPNGNLSWFTTNTLPVAIYHDQEPLQFDYYSKPVLEEFFINWEGLSIREVGVALDHRVRGHLRGLFLYNAHDLTILCHSEKNSSELQKYENRDFVGVYYWSHALIARDWFRFAEHDRLLDQRVSGPMFLVYNRSWAGSREYRLTFTEMIVNQQLVNSCLMKFASQDQGYYKDHCFSNPSLAIQRQDLEQHFDANTAAATSSADYHGQDYASTKIEVVLETLFDDYRWHLTEKTLRPIACGKPFILAASPGSLKYLQSYGFETFSPWIDETYDTVNDPLERLKAVVAEMRRINDLPLTSQQELFRAIDAIAQRNKKLFFSDAWAQGIVQEYQTNFDSAMVLVKNSINGSYWKELEKIYQEHDLPSKKFYNRAQPGRRTEQEMRLYLEMINKHS